MDLSWIGLLFDLGVLLLNLLLIGILTGPVSRWLVRHRPKAWSVGYTRFLLGLTVVTIGAIDLLLVLEAID